MSFPSLQLTDAGRSIIVAALAGGSIEFTKIGVGSGNAPANPNALTELVNPVKTIGIGEIETGDGCANLTAVLDNANLEAGYWWKEIGVYALDANENEVVYAYAHAGEYADYIPAYSSTSYLRTTINATVVVGSAENVSAVISEYIGYVTTETYQGHVEDTNNPHQVTKEQVGLGDVPNVSTNDQTPTFTKYPAPAQLASGLTMSELFSRLMADVEYLLNHATSTNPHHITLSKIGAAAESHEHPASDITSGTLPIARGGTGGATAQAARTSLGVDSLYKLVAFTSGIINFTATNTSGAYVEGNIPITTYAGYKPVAVAGWSVINDGTTGSHDKFVSPNNIEIRDTYVVYHLYNTYSSANHCKLNAQVLYIRNT